MDEERPQHEFRFDGYTAPRTTRFYIRMVLATVIVSLGVFVLLPFTQLLSGDPRDTFQIRQVDVALPPPPPPPEPPPPPPEEEQRDTPELETTPPPLNLSQLEAALNPGIGGAGGAGFGFDAFAVRPDAAGEVRIFEIADLDRRPRRTTTIMPEYPAQLQLEGVEGEVRLEVMIDEQGAVTILSVISATHNEFVQPARQAVSRWRFEPPTRDGVPVRARYVQPIPFRLQ